METDITEALLSNQSVPAAVSLVSAYLLSLVVRAKRRSAVVWITELLDGDYSVHVRYGMSFKRSVCHSGCLYVINSGDCTPSPSREMALERAKTALSRLGCPSGATMTVIYNGKKEKS